MSDAKTFIILNAIIVTLLVAYFLTLKKKVQPTKLNLKNDKPLQSAPVPETQTVVLNVFFNYNGHSFDAYEALGVPAGSTMDEVQAGLQKTLSSVTDSGSQEFYKTAFKAIQNASQRR